MRAVVRAEINPGPGRTVVTAVCRNALTTLSARVTALIAFRRPACRDHPNTYVPAADPAGTAPARCVYVALHVRTYLLLTITCGALLGEVGLLQNLAGREHLVAIALGALAYCADKRLSRREKH